jgi:1-deoxy-D-xylulose-5-phosphate synthase
MSSLLARVNHPNDVKSLTLAELEQLAGEIRQRVLEVVDKNGGHLGSNLGSVELTLALHKVFDLPRDRLVWDTSHQTYPHKLVTGRRDRFHLIRTYGGICGFSNHRESIFDLFDAGHAGTACSLALGVGTADRLLGREAKTIAVVGDSAAASGMTFEALNHGGENRQNFLVILNDNNMSINKAVGALSKYFTRVRTKPAYQDLKRELHAILSRIPVLGTRIEEVLHDLHERVRHSVVPGVVFQELGYNYYGPIDGHDLAGLIRLLEDLREIREPVLLHLATQKGRGFPQAEADPIKYHALKDFLPKKKEEGVEASSAATAAPEPSPKAAAPRKRPSYSDVFQEAILEAARKDRRVCAITAGMPDGTGLVAFSKEFPERYFDVGICEQHGAAFSSGLAYGGMRPVYAVYSTFCQRAYDQFIHDVCIQETSVVFCLDRAGLTGEDGWTHHGVFDIAYMRCVPGVILMAPRDAEELVRMLQLALDQSTAPVAIRYPKATCPELPASREPNLRPGKAEVLVEGEDVALFAYGSMVDEAFRALGALKERGVEPTLVNARFAKPLDTELLRRLAATHRVLVTLEEHVLMGGFGSAVVEALADGGITFEKVLRIGVPDRFVTFGSRQKLLEECELDAVAIARRVAAECSSSRTRRAPASREELAAAGRLRLAPQSN